MADDKKITQYDALTAPADEDLLVIVDDPSGTPTTKKITLSSLEDGYVTGDLVGTSDSQTLTNKTLTNPVINYTDTTIGMNVKARAYLGTNQLNLVSGVYTKVLLDTETYDVGSDFDLANHRFVAPVNGYYLVTGCVGFLNIVADKRYVSCIWVNGSVKSQAVGHASAADQSVVFPNVVDILYLTATQYVELYAYSNAGVDTVDIEGYSQSTWMSIHLLSV